MCTNKVKKKNFNFMRTFKGVIDCFFLRFVFMGCSLTCLMLRFIFFKQIFHIIYLYSTPLCPFSHEHSDDFLFLALPSEIRNV